MAVQYEVTRIRDDNGGYSKGANQDALRIEWAATYQVIVSDPSDQNFTGADITAFDVAAAPGLPLVNYTTYFENGFVIPFLVCRSKRAARDANNNTRWLVSTTWDSGDKNDQLENENQPIDPPVNLTDFTPREELELGEIELVRYNDVDDPPEPIRLPTGNDFPQPAIIRYPTQILKITQYESFVSYQTMEDRKFLINSIPYRGKNIGAWLIQQVEAREVTVQLAAGQAVVAEVTYTLESNPSPNGWFLDWALIDTHYLEQANDLNTKKAFQDKDYLTYINGLIQADGTQKPNQLGEPDYVQFQVYKDDNFSFLQV